MKKLLFLCVFLGFGIICYAQDMVPIPGTNIEMMKTEVTQRLYKEIMGENPSSDIIYDALNSDGLFNKVKKLSNARLPVNNVSWFDAIEFCNALSRSNGLTEVYIIEKNDAEVDMQIKQLEQEMKKEGFPDQIIQKRVKEKKAELQARNQQIKQRYGFEVSLNEKANGFRLPTISEWKKAWAYMFDGKELVDLDKLNLEWCWDLHEKDYSGTVHYVGNWQEGPGMADAPTRAPILSFRVVRTIK